MKKFVILALFAGFLTFSVSSCRDQKPEEVLKSSEQTLIEDMQNKGADVKVKSDGETKKIIMETDDEKLKIKTDKDGNTKIKKKDKN